MFFKVTIYFKLRTQVVSYTEKYGYKYVCHGKVFIGTKSMQNNISIWRAKIIRQQVHEFISR